MPRQSAKIRYREKVPWYLWRINLGAVLVAGLLGWTAWESLTDPVGGGDPDPVVDWTARILGFALFGGLAIYCLWSLWVNRYPLRFRITPNQQERAEMLAQIRAELADLARMSEKADRLLGESTDVVTDSQLQDIRERLERMEGEYVEIVRDLGKHK